LTCQTALAEMLLHLAGTFIKCSTRQLGHWTLDSVCPKGNSSSFSIRCRRCRCRCRIQICMCIFIWQCAYETHTKRQLLLVKRVYIPSIPLFPSP